MSKPSLALIPTAYKAGKLYSVLPEDGSGDFTVSRNGTGTYLVQDGFIKTALPNEPRFEYNSDGTFKAVLVEPAATNMLLRTQDFANSYWLKNNSSVQSTVQISPDGVSNVVKFVTNQGISSNSGEVRNAIFSAVIGQFYTWSIYIKKAEDRYITMTAWSNDDPRTIFDLDTLTFTEIGPSHSSSIVNAGNGWFRIIITRQLISNTVIFLRLRSSTLAQQNTANGINGVFIWGAQVEVGTVATSYIPTLNSQVTRPADVMTVIVPLSATQVSYILNGNTVTQSVIGGSTFTLPNGHITQLTMD
jgi:hypothetical protein